MKVLPTTITDDELRHAVADWSEALAEGRFQDALEMFPPKPGLQLSPSQLEQWIANYGSDKPRRDGSRWRITTLRARSDADDMIAHMIEIERDNRHWIDADYLGMVHYSDVPLNGERSDLTARFMIKRIGDKCITLEFIDLHMM